MKGLISGIKRMEIHDGDGLRTTVFFKGCPMRCLWCHNPESISFTRQINVLAEKCIGCGSCRQVCPRDAISLETGHSVVSFSSCDVCCACVDACPVGAIFSYGREYTVNELVDMVMQDALFYQNSGGGVTLSGGECLAQADFAVAVAKKLHEHQISVDIDTCGFVNQEVFRRILPCTDTFLYDIKAIDPAVHKKCTEQDNRLILDNLQYLCKNHAKIEIRYPLVMGYNDRECAKIGQFLTGLSGIIRVKVLRYHTFAASRYRTLGMTNSLPDTVTTPEDVQNAVRELEYYGLSVVQ